MGNPLRNSDPEAFRLISNRTMGARLWMQPNSTNRRLVGGIVARYQELLGIELYAFCFLSNHYHMVIRAPRGNADEFLENVDREIARRMNWRLRREGKFWHRRYTEQIILSEDDLLEAFLYVNSNPSRHGLLKDSSQWKGLNSYRQSLKQRHKSFSFTMFSEPDMPKQRHTLRLSILPQFQNMSFKARRGKLQALLEERQRDIAEERYALGLGFLGAEKLAEQELGDVPQEVSRSPRPACYSKSSELIKEFMKNRRERIKYYAESSFLYRFGVKDVTFPEHSYLPPRHRLPRRAPFVIDERPEIFLQAV